MAIAEQSPGRLQFPTYKGAIFRYQSIDLRDWHKEAEILYCGKLGAKPAGNPREYKFPGGPVIRSGHLQDGGYINYVGWEIHKLAVDEATHLPTVTNRENGQPECPDYLLLVRGSLRLSPDGNSQAFLTGNPGFKGDRWVKHRFIKVYQNGVLVPPRTTFKDPISGHTRVFINATVFENPWILKNDPGFVRGLLELSPAKQKAWLWGDWDSFEGQYFEEFDKGVHVVEADQVRAAIPPYVYRWMSCDWGYAHACAVYRFAQGLDGRVHAEQELSFDNKTGSFMVGVEIAKANFQTLSTLPDNHMTLYLSHDAFHETDDNKRTVETMAAGIRTVLGPQSCFILEMTADEKAEAAKDPDAAVRRMNARRAEMTNGWGITIVCAPRNSVNGWNYFRELLRIRTTEVNGAPDASVVQHLRTYPNGEQLVANYLNGFVDRVEVTPKILIHSCCPRVIETLPEMVHDENNPEKMKKVDGDDHVDGLMYGVMAHRDQQNQMPLSYFVSHQLQQVFGNRGREVDMSTAHLMNLTAKEKHDKLYGTDPGMRLGRFAGRGMLGVN